MYDELCSALAEDEFGGGSASDEICNDPWDGLESPLEELLTRVFESAAGARGEAASLREERGLVSSLFLPPPVARGHAVAAPMHPLEHEQLLLSRLHCEDEEQEDVVAELSPYSASAPASPLFPARWRKGADADADADVYADRGNGDGADEDEDEDEGSPSSSGPSRGASKSKASKACSALGEGESRVGRGCKVAELEGALSELRVVGAFEEASFVERYQRNNKCSGLKNLRCFPNCGEAHQTRKFCGQSVVFRCVQSKGMTAAASEPSGASMRMRVRRTAAGRQLLGWGRFDLAEPGPDAPHVAVGSLVPRSEIAGVERKRGKPFLPWYPSKSTRRSEVEGEEKEQFEFTFSSDNQGWHYGWQGTKHTCTLEHVFKVYVFCKVEEAPEHLLCVGIFDSPRFSIYCRRRQRFNRADCTEALSKTTAQSRLLWFVLSHLDRVRLPSEEEAEEEEEEEEDGRVQALVRAGSPQSGALALKMQDTLDAFARHIVQETAFTSKIAKLCQEVSYRRDRGESVDKGFRLFLGVLSSYIQEYFQKRGISLDDFSKLESFFKLNKQLPQQPVPIPLAAAAAAADKDASEKARPPPQRAGRAAAAASSSSSSNINNKDSMCSARVTALKRERGECESRSGADSPLFDGEARSPNGSAPPENEFRVAFLELIDGKSEVARDTKRPRRAETKVLEELSSAFSGSAGGDTLGAEQLDLSVDRYLAFSSDKEAAETDLPLNRDEVWARHGFRRRGELAQIDGKWGVEPSAATRALEHLRGWQLAMSSILCKLMAQMEREIRFEMHRGTIKCFLCPKLLSDGFIEYPTDGLRHAFTFQTPLLGCVRPMALTKQAFVVGNAVVIRHEYNATARMTRVVFRKGPQTLKVYGYYETRDAASSAWHIQGALDCEPQLLTP